VVREKADPFARCTELPPATASITWALDHKWKDKKWLKKRTSTQRLEDPKSIYEVHLGSWKKNADGHSLSYRELANDLVQHVKTLGFTHIELMPIQEHPFYPSWGYQSTSYFAPTRRYGDPEDLMYFIDACHKEDLGVILDWVPSHFPADDHGLALFDGSCVYEHPDPRKGYHPDWKSSIFNYERPEVRSFLLSSAHFWLSHYHIDGLRVDAVASMIYLDYSREEGQWEPNIYGGNEYLAAVDFLKDLNSSAYQNHEGVIMIAEESTAFPGVTKPVHFGGLGFGYKWMMGWMNDTLRYFERDPIHRRYHHNEISFSLAYANSENYILPLSHDEVVYGKKALLDKMPGDEWQRFAELRLLYTYMFTHPGGKLIFMGGEIGQVAEWNINEQLEWFVMDYPLHKGISDVIKDLNGLYRSEPALHEKDHDPSGFTWIDHSDHENCVLAYTRQSGQDQVVVVLNFTPQTLTHYRLGVDKKGVYEEAFNSDAMIYQGSGQGNTAVSADKTESHGRPYSLSLTIPPLGGIVLKNK
jgi:1,4-alpha-glucan branching enzyme